MYPSVHQASGARSLSISPDSSRPPPAPANPILTEDESFRFNRLRVRADEAERRLRVTQADATILKSKQAAMVERENFLLHEIRQLNDHLLCKLFPLFPLYWLVLVNRDHGFSVGAQLDPGAETRRVNLKLNSIADLASRGAPGFWSDRDRGYVLVTLQDRVNQVESFVESCRSCLERVFTTLFPLNPVPQSLADLMKRFRQGEAIEGFVREQLEAGARFAFALVLIHHPHLDLGDISRGPSEIGRAHV